MKARIPNMQRLALALAAGYWLLESFADAFAFGKGSLSEALICELDPNEFWMRLVIVALFVVFGRYAERALHAERQLREDAQRITALRRLVDAIRDVLYAPEKPNATGSDGAASPTPASHDTGAIAAASPPADRQPIGDDLAAVATMLNELPAFLETRFHDLQALLELTHEINKGLLLEEILDKAYDSLHAVIPYNRMGVALLEDEGKTARSCWARSDSPHIRLGRDYSAPLLGSSLQQVLDSGEPRILNDLERYLEEHPDSVSTRMMVMEGIRSSLTCPLIAVGKPVGFIFFSSRKTDVYRNVHIDIFRLLAGYLSVVVEKGHMYQQILREKKKSEDLLLNVMPPRVAERLRQGEETIAEELPQAAILFADIAGFTSFASRYPPEKVVALLRDVFVGFDELCDRYGVEKIKTVGDEYMAITGTSGSEGRVALRDMADFALHMLRSLKRTTYPDGQPLRIRIGLHAGPAVAGIIGQKKFSYDIWGDSVNVANRMQSTGEAGQIHVTEAVYSMLKDEFEFVARGEIGIKGKGLMRTYFLARRKSGSTRAGDVPVDGESASSAR